MKPQSTVLIGPRGRHEIRRRREDAGFVRVYDRIPYTAVAADAEFYHYADRSGWGLGGGSKVVIKKINKSSEIVRF